MAAPTFVAASTGSTDATGAWNHTGAAPGASGRLLMCVVVVDGVTAGTPTITSTTNIQSLSGTASQWTAAPGNPYAIGSPTAAGTLLFFARSTSTSAPVITGANVGGDDVYVRIYEFQDVNTGSTISAILENGSAGTLVSNPVTLASGGIPDTGVTTLGADRLALNVVSCDDDNSWTTFTGMTGGTWALASTVYADAGGTDAALSVMTAAMASAGTIDGGTTPAVAPDNYGVVGFALIGTSAGGSTYTKAGYGKESG